MVAPGRGKNKKTHAREVMALRFKEKDKRAGAHERQPQQTAKTSFSGDSAERVLPGENAGLSSGVLRGPRCIPEEMSARFYRKLTAMTT